MKILEGWYDCPSMYCLQIDCCVHGHYNIIGLAGICRPTEYVAKLHYCRGFAVDIIYNKLSYRAAT